MQVIFATKSKNQNRYTISRIPGHGKIWFDKGVKSTTDKDLIKKLLNNKLYERGDYHLVTNEEIVAKYLDGEYSDKLTKELIENLTLQGVKELGKILHTKSEQPTLIKVEAEGKPITNAVQEVLDFYSLNKEEKEPVKEKKTETIEAKNSKDMNAKEAISYIEDHSIVTLDGFLSEDEDRKTVLQAFQDKLEEE